MRSRFQLFSACQLAILMVLQTPAVRAGDIQGTVTDYVTNKAIPGVAVNLLAAGGKNALNTTSDANGIYKFADVLEGMRTVKFDKVNYTPRPDPEQINVQAGGNNLDVQLMAETNNVQYYQLAGERYLALAKQAGGNREDYITQWDHLRRFTISPKHKVELAKTVQQKDQNNAMAVPGLAQYRELDLDNLERLQARFVKAVEGRQDIPSKATVNEFRIREEPLVDMVLYAVHSSKTTAANKSKFVNKFTEAWGNTEVGEKLQESYQKNTGSRRRPQ